MVSQSGQGPVPLD